MEISEMIVKIKRDGLWKVTVSATIKSELVAEMSDEDVFKVMAQGLLTAVKENESTG